MYSLLLAVVVSAQVGDAEWIGTMTCVMDRAVIDRQGASYAGRVGAGLKLGDTVSTSANGGTSLYFSDEQVIHLAGDTRVEVTATAGRLALLLHSGELRLTNGGAQTVIVKSSVIHLEVPRAIVRVAVAESFHRLAIEHGTATAILPQARHELSAPDELRVQTHDLIVSAARFAKAQWSIRADAYQAAAEHQIAANGGAPAAPRGRRSCCPPGQSPADMADSPAREATPDQDAQTQQPPAAPPVQDRNVSNYSVAAASSLSLGSLASASFGGSASAGYNADANQATLQGQLIGDFNNNGMLLPAGSPFPGNIHLVTGETRYNFADLPLTPGEQAAMFPGGNPAYWSIGVGPLPQAQVFTDLQTASSPVPHTVAIPRFEAYLLRLDQYGTVDAALNPDAAEANNVGTFGFLGTTPTAPTITGADPLLDARSANQINPRATFATGEFRLMPGGNGVDLAIRSSDQDRTIVKDANNNDALDMVKPNLDASFREVADPRFFPAAPLVQVPERNNNFRRAETTYSNLDLLRRAAVTTLMADQLHDYARRTGQTRFVIREADGRQRIVDISGYRRP